MTNYASLVDGLCLSTTLRGSNPVQEQSHQFASLWTAGQDLLSKKALNLKTFLPFQQRKWKHHNRKHKAIKWMNSVSSEGAYHFAKRVSKTGMKCLNFMFLSVSKHLPKVCPWNERPRGEVESQGWWRTICQHGGTHEASEDIWTIILSSFPRVFPLRLRGWWRVESIMIRLGESRLWARPTNVRGRSVFLLRFKSWRSWKSVDGTKKDIGNYVVLWNDLA